MATADDRRLRRLTALGVVGALVLSAVVALVVLRRGPDAPEARPEPVAVESSTRHRFADLDALLAASDLVVSARVASVGPGRVFGDVGETGRAEGTAVRSQVLTLEVGRVLAGTGAPRDPGAPTVVLVEEEAELTDGTPLRVDGARPSQLDDDGIWFLTASGDPDFPGYMLVNSQARYLATGTHLVGADRADRLVHSLEALGPDGLERALTGAAG